MQTVKEFIGELGGTVFVATELGLPISTVSGWNISNSVPSWREPALRALAARLDKEYPREFAERAA
jgi:hypothetical protein